MLVMSFFICVSSRLLLVIEADGDDFASGVAVRMLLVGNKAM